MYDPAPGYFVDQKISYFIIIDGVKFRCTHDGQILGLWNSAENDEKPLEHTAGEKTKSNIFNYILYGLAAYGLLTLLKLR